MCEYIILNMCAYNKRYRPRNLDRHAYSSFGVCIQRNRRACHTGQHFKYMFITEHGFSFKLNEMNYNDLLQKKKLHTKYVCLFLQCNRINSVSMMKKQNISTYDNECATYLCSLMSACNFIAAAIKFVITVLLLQFTFVSELLLLLHL